MKNLDKIVFLQMTCKQFSKMPSETADYFNIYKSLTKVEEEEFIKLSKEIHSVWSFINSRTNDHVKSVQDYNDKVTPVNSKILQLAKDFNLTLKDDITSETKDAIIAVFGIDYFISNFK
jgi:hypothetical protein